MDDLDLDQKVSTICSISLIVFSLLCVAFLFFVLYEEGKLRIPFLNLYTPHCQFVIAGSTSMYVNKDGGKEDCNKWE